MTDQMHMWVYIDRKKEQEAQLLLVKPIVLRTTYGIAAERYMEWPWAAW